MSKSKKRLKRPEEMQPFPVRLPRQDTERLISAGYNVSLILREAIKDAIRELDSMESKK